ncbi:hypothetical protein [Bradyrhizobium sp. dw_78]|uniref:hypothetical protein n=1 Tax=Bradyrhizobium sp. dw_78 TaxID=2719793 RepID=UPI001BD5B92E|nr:hypothetical protein [Bradyrhizobium sp. dw_78]
MKNYSIVRVGDEYVVRADDQSILKVASRRKAAQLVAEAAELLDSQAVAQTPLQPNRIPSIECDPDVAFDSSEAS